MERQGGASVAEHAASLRSDTASCAAARLQRRAFQPFTKIYNA
jgi:hypothetical protein